MPLYRSITEGDPRGDREASWTGQLYGQDKQVFARWSEVQWSRQCKQRPSAKSKTKVVLGPWRAGALTERSQDWLHGHWGAMEAFMLGSVPVRPVY